MTHTTENSSPPIKIEGFKFLSEIGHGATSTVWIVESRVDSSKHVIKIFQKEFSGQEDRFRFDRECKSLVSLKHKNIVSLETWGINDGIPWIMFPYVESLTLTDYLKKNAKLSIPELLKIFMEICDGIDYSHRQKIIHRDLKPDNILVDGNNTPFIIDYGMAKSELLNTVQTATGVIVGTPAFMDPQIVFGTAKSSFRTDTYSLGVILYYMLTGTTPFGRKSIGETVSLMIRGDYSSVNTINPKASFRLSELVSQMIAPKGEDRSLHTPEDLRAGLLKYLSVPESGKNITTRSASPGGKRAKARKTVGETVSFKGNDKGSSSSNSFRQRWIRIAPLIIFIIILCGFIGKWLVEDKDNEIESLIDSGNYFNLGQRLISQGQYGFLEKGGAFVSLAGRVEGIKHFEKRDPSKAMKIYLETLELPTLCRTKLEVSAFNLVEPLVSSLPKRDVSSFYEKISNIVWFKNEGHQREAIIAYRETLASLDPEKQALYRLRAFLFNCSNNDFSSDNYDEVLKEAGELLSEVQAKLSPLPELKYFDKRSHRTFARPYLEAAQTGYLFSKLFSDRGRGMSAGELYEYRTRLPLTIALIGFCHQELVDDVLGEQNTLLAGGLKIMVDSEVNKFTILEQKIAWSYISPWLERSADSKVPLPYVPMQLFPREYVIRLARFGARVGETKLINDLSRLWMHHYPYAEDFNDILLEFRGVAYAYNELNKINWLTEKNSYPPIDEDYVLEALQDVGREIIEVESVFNISLTKDLESYLSFLFVYLMQAGDHERAAVIYRNLLNSCKPNPYRFIDLFPYVRRLWIGKDYHLPKAKEELTKVTIQYAQTLTDFPRVQAEICLMLLSASVDPLISSQLSEKLIVSEEIQEMAGKSLRKSPVVLSFSFLETFSDLQLGKGALLSRLKLLSGKLKNTGNIDGNIDLSLPENLSPNDSLLYGWFVAALLDKVSGTDVRFFLKNSFPEFKKWLEKRHPLEGHLLYSYMLLQGLKRSDKIISIENMSGGQMALAREASEYMKANVRYMNKEKLIHLSPFITRAFIGQEYEPALELLCHHIRLIESSCSHKPSELLNFGRLQLASGLSKHVVETSPLSLEERFRRDGSGDLLQPSISMREFCLSIMEPIFKGSRGNISLVKWKFIQEMSFLYMWRKDYNSLAALFDSYNIDDAPPTRRAPLTEKLLKCRFGILNVLEENNDEAGIKKERARIKKLAQKYGKLPRHSAFYVQNAYIAIYDKSVRNLVLTIEL